MIIRLLNYLLVLDITYFKKKNKLFINAGINITEFIVNGTITYSNGTQVLDLEADNNYFFGFGFDFKSKYMFEFRINTQKNLSKTSPYDVNYQNFSIKFGYNLL